MTLPETERDWERPASASLEDWQDVLVLRDAFEGFDDGSVSADELRAARQIRGIYPLKPDGVYMVRVAVPLGRLTPQQLRTTAAVSRSFGDGALHLTTRQSLQIYGVAADHVPAAAAALAEAGLTTRESTGPTVRNVTVCSLAGICSAERFDVSPHAAALSAHLKRHPLAQGLPRKVKIAFSGCGLDCGLAEVHDLGFIATEDGGKQPRFRIVAGGGLGARPRLAATIRESTPASEIQPVAEAILRIHAERSDRNNRKRARLKFLVERLGADNFRELVETERAAAGANGGEILHLALHTSAPPSDTPPKTANPAASEPIAQRQAGYFAVPVLVSCGLMTTEQAEATADIAARYGRDTIHLTQMQGMLLPWVAQGNIAAVRYLLERAGLSDRYAGTAADVVSCPSSPSCPTGLLKSRHAANVLSDLLQADAESDELQDTVIRVSGCPNSCGHSPLGTIGLNGGAANVQGRKVPCYQVSIGGQGAGGIRLGRPLVKVPARRLPQLVERLLAIYRRDRLPDERLDAFLERVDSQPLAEAMADLAALTVYPGEEETLFCDWGSDRPFSVKDTGNA